jgi:lipid-A-disaccharide synthase
MLAAARQMEGYRLVVTAAPGIEDDFYAPLIDADVTLTRDTYGTLLQAKAAVVNSGTATLETALLRCPQVAVYYLSPEWFIRLFRWLQPLIFSIPYFTLVNIIGGKEIIKECLGNDFTVENVATELRRLLTDEDYTKNMLASYEHIRSLLGTQSAASTAAALITKR